MEEEVKPAESGPPRGIYPARVDDKGRLKLPVNFERFLSGEPLFVTSWDGRMARIYKLPVWQENELLLFAETDDPEAAEDLSFLAYKYGADSDVDGQGRLLMPTDLRRALTVSLLTAWIDKTQQYSIAEYLPLGSTHSYIAAHNYVDFTGGQIWQAAPQFRDAGVPEALLDRVLQYGTAYTDRAARIHYQ